ncbi:MAG TPA: hypothetical protein VNY09_04040 [Candidatus Sulfotelmatobacter sp.]|jgi:hypothetical protein|nr:hypothetical protein [Candidatus Sulfotelmatobacter sp.]
MELTFSSAGPIVNLPIALVVRRKDALVGDMELRATHENGETHVLRWMFILEVLTSIGGLPQNQSLNFLRQDRAITLLASPSTVINKTTGFQDSSFQETYRQKFAALADHYQFLKGREHGRDEFLQSRELAVALQWFQDAMFWSEGRYKFEAEMTIEGLRRPIVTVFYADINKAEADLLRQNIEKMKEYAIALVSADAKGERASEPVWNWIFPSVTTDR